MLLYVLLLHGDHPIDSVASDFAVSLEWSTSAAIPTRRFGSVELYDLRREPALSGTGSQ